MDDIYHRVLGLFVAAILVALAARRLRLPYTVGLVAAGVALALLHKSSGALLTHDLIFELILPPLLFEAALSIHWDELRRDAATVLALAGLGVVITAAIVGGGLMAVLGWPLGAAAYFRHRPGGRYRPVQGSGRFRTAAVPGGNRKPAQ